MPAAAPIAAAPAAPSPPLWPLPALLLLGFAAWFGVWNGGLFFDDQPSIQNNGAIMSGAWWTAAFGSVHTPISHRPLTCLSLVLDRALLWPAPSAHRLVNLLLHLVNIALVFAVVRRALRGPNLGARFAEPRATAVAFATAALFAVHPLGADAVAYSTQRSTLLLAALLLTALYATLRAVTSPLRATAWRATAVACLALGMAAKEEMVGAVLLLPLFVRAFLVPSWREVGAHRRSLLAAAASWLVLLLCVLNGPRNRTVGYDTTPPATAIEWLQTQAGIVVHYLRLVVWPHGLRGCYDWPIVRELGPALLPGALIVVLIALTAVAWRRRPQLGFLGAWLFLLLAPTSTVLPIVTELAAERRMYLPMLAVLVPAGLALDAVRRRAGWRVAVPLLAALLLALTFVTRGRIAAYRDEDSFWTDAHAWHDPEHRTYTAAIMLDCVGRMARARGDVAGALERFAEAIACETPPIEARLHHASVLLELGRDQEAAPRLAAIGEEAPIITQQLIGLVNSQLQTARQRPAGSAATDRQLLDAELNARTLVALQPTRPEPLQMLARVRLLLGRGADAEADLQRALALEPDAAPQYGKAAELLLEFGLAPAAERLWRGLLSRRPADVALRLEIASKYLGSGRLDLAHTMFLEAQRLQPDNPAARDGLAEIERRAARR